MAATKKTLRLTVESVDRSKVTLELNGKEIVFPRASLPSVLHEGDTVTLEISVDAAPGSRDEYADEVDAKTTRRVGARKRGNPRSASARGSKK